MKIPKAIQNVIDSFERLPGIGPKTAEKIIHSAHEIILKSGKSGEPDSVAAPKGDKPSEKPEAVSQEPVEGAPPEEKTEPTNESS